MRYLPIKTHVFNGKRYRIKFRKPYKAMGLCDPPDRPGKTIMLHPHPPDVVKGPGDWQALYLAIHEALHALLWDHDESSIKQKGYDLAHFLWKLGFRPQKPPKPSKASKG